MTFILQRMSPILSKTAPRSPIHFIVTLENKLLILDNLLQICFGSRFDPNKVYS
jgi:hypothetical protein